MTSLFDQLLARNNCIENVPYIILYLKETARKNMSKTHREKMEYGLRVRLIYTGNYTFIFAEICLLYSLRTHGVTYSFQPEHPRIFPITDKSTGSIFFKHMKIWCLQGVVTDE